MFKRIKESEFYNKYKDLKSNPQIGTRMSLGLWLLFFIIIVLFTRGINTNRPYERENVSKINSYEYTYQNNRGTVFGRFYNGKQVFNILNSKYYYNGENAYIINENKANLALNFNMNVLKIDLYFIDELTNKLDYTEFDNVKQYLVPLANFINLYEVDTAIDLSYASNYNIIVRKYFNDVNLYKIEIDLSNYYMINNLNDDGKLVISLYNVNKLNDFTLEYDRIVGVE